MQYFLFLKERVIKICMKGKEKKHMASVNYEKIKSVAVAKAMFRHCDKALRVETEHANKDINKDWTMFNTQSVKSYKEACERFDRRLNYIDSLPNANKRKDRVVLFGLDIPKPKDLIEDDENEWFYEVGKIIRKFYGKENVIADYIHRDEVHKYLNPKTNEEELSRVHQHIYIIPFCKYKLKKKNGLEITVEKLSGKEFSKKSNIIALNKAIEDMTRIKYNCRWQTGEKTKSTASVEELKKTSLKAEYKKLSQLKATNELAYAIVEREHQYKALKEDIRIVSEQPTADKLDEICERWGCQEYQIKYGDNVNVFRQKTALIKEFLNEILNWFIELFDSVLGYQYERDKRDTKYFDYYEPEIDI